MRGYGQSFAPVEAEAYMPFETVGDLVAILDAAGVTTASVVGHDFGANIAWNAAMMRPDRFTAVCGMSVPFRPPGSPSFLDKFRAAGKSQFYWFDMMRAESDQAWENAAVTVPGMMYWTSGEAPEAGRWVPSIHHADCCARPPGLRERSTQTTLLMQLQPSHARDSMERSTTTVQSTPSHVTRLLSRGPKFGSYPCFWQVPVTG